MKVLSIYQTTASAVLIGWLLYWTARVWELQLVGATYDEMVVPAVVALLGTLLGIMAHAGVYAFLRRVVLLQQAIQEDFRRQKARVEMLRREGATATEIARAERRLAAIERNLTNFGANGS